MSSKFYTVETRGQGALIFGGGELGLGLSQELLALGLSSLVVSNEAQIKDFRGSHDLDYLVVFPDHDLAPYQALFSELIDSSESRLITIHHQDEAENQIELDYHQNLVYSDYIGEGEYRSNTISTWLAQLQAQKTLTIPGDGLSTISLLTQSDLVALLALAILNPRASSGDTIMLGNPEGISLLNLAYLIRTSLPHKVSLSFDSQKEVVANPPNIEEYATSLKVLDYKLRGSIEQVFQAYLKSRPSQKLPPVAQPPSPPFAPKPEIEPERIKKLTPLTHKPAPVFVPLTSQRPKLRFPPIFSRQTSRPALRPLNIFTRSLLVALALYLGSLAFTATISALSLRSLANNLKAGELPPQNSLATLSLTYLQANWFVLTTTSGIKDWPAVAQTSLLLDAYSQTQNIIAIAQSLSHTSSDLAHYIFGGGEADIVQTISQARLEIEELYQKLSLLDGYLPQDPQDIIPDAYHSAYLQGREELSSIKRSVITAKAVLATTPDLIGLGSRRKYGVLFQNNMELRSTGGFIGSFAILSFENGKLYDMPIYDVYDADGQLKGHVEPPAPIKDILGEASWYLRDSNFDPDFPTSARRAEWFINKSLNQDLDGTIAVNLNTLTALLSATGPLEVIDYNESISGDNLYERAQFHAEVNFFPGSTQKKEFLSSVAQALFVSLPDLSPQDTLKVMRSLSSTVASKDTLVSLLSPNTNQVFATLGWDGALLDLPCPGLENCYKDYAMLVDNNYGVNKANYYLTRKLEHIITLDKDLSANHTMRVHYQNNATSTSWPAGPYKNYGRLYLPIGANIQSVKIDGKTLNNSEYQIEAQHNKTVISYELTVPISTSLVLEVAYSTPQLPQTDDILYTWHWQKQPGTSSSDPLTVYLNYPLFLNPTIVAPEAELLPQQLKFALQNDTDRRVTVKFSR